MKVFRRILYLLFTLGGLILLYVGGVILYAWINDYLPPPKEEVGIVGPAAEAPLNRDTLSLFNWNIGYAGLGRESDFFYDGGKSVRQSKEVVQKNLRGVTGTLERYRDKIDFYLLQEVDLDSRRSHVTDQVQAISQVLPGFYQAFGKNYEVEFVPVPFTNPMGKVRSGISTWSRFKPEKAIRHNFEGNYAFPNYLFFLDRCFLLERFPLPNNKELVLINTHNSAYDDGTLKQRQMLQLKEVLLTEYDRGNYVVVGGDWNQFPANYTGVQGFTPPSQSSKLYVSVKYPDKDWQWAFDPEVATNRSLSAPFDADSTQRGIIDFYLLSPNIELLKVKTLDMNFRFSDHQPVLMDLVLKGFRPQAAGENLESP